MKRLDISIIFLSNKGNSNILNPYYVINGYSSTAAEKNTQKENGIKFIDLNNQPADTEQTYTYINDLVAGDINLDNKIDVNDVTLLQNYSAGNAEFNDFQYKKIQLLPTTSHQLQLIM